MMTDDIIAALASDVVATPRHAVGRRLGRGLAMGAIIAVAIMVLWLGVRADLMDAMRTGPFWMKFAYALSVSALGFGLIDRLARPDGEGGVFGPMILAPLAVCDPPSIVPIFLPPRAVRMKVMLCATHQRLAR